MEGSRLPSTQTGTAGSESAAGRPIPTGSAGTGMGMGIGQGRGVAGTQGGQGISPQSQGHRKAAAEALKRGDYATYTAESAKVSRPYVRPPFSVSRRRSSARLSCPGRARDTDEKHACRPCQRIWTKRRRRQRAARCVLQQPGMRKAPRMLGHPRLSLPRRGVKARRTPTPAAWDIRQSRALKRQPPTCHPSSSMVEEDKLCR